MPLGDLEHLRLIVLLWSISWTLTTWTAWTSVVTTWAAWASVITATTLWTVVTWTLVTSWLALRLYITFWLLDEGSA